MAFTRDTLRTFLAVLDHGSFSAAARHLGRVPSAVSMAVSQLEAELDLALFDRSTRKALPTPAALALEPQARQAASQLNLLDAHALQLHQGLERRLSLAIAPELQSGPWSRPLASLAQTFPALEVEVRSASQAEAIRLLHAGEVHLALVFERPGIDEREAFQEAGSQVLVAVAAPGFAPQALDERRLATCRQIIVASGQPTASDPQIVLAHRVWLCDSHLAALELVQAGVGWAYLPQPLVAPLLASGALDPLRFDNMSSQLRIGVDIVWLKASPRGLGAQHYLARMREQLDGDATL